MNNQEIKENLVNKISNLSIIQRKEIFNIIKKENINYNTNNNGIFINLTKVPIELIIKINQYIIYLDNNQENLNKIENYCNDISNLSNENEIIFKIINFEEFKNLKDCKFLEKIKEELIYKKKKEMNSHSKFINTIKKYQRLLYLNIENENLNNLKKEKNLLKK